jgi:hypothetical protein
VLAGGRVAGHRRLAKIQALRTDLADMVDAHQPGRMVARRCLHDDIGGLLPGIGALGRWVAEHGVQRALGLGEQVVDRGGGAHGRHAVGLQKWEGNCRCGGLHCQAGLWVTCTGAALPVQSGLLSFTLYNAWQSSGGQSAAIRPT